MLVSRIRSGNDRTVVREIEIKKDSIETKQWQRIKLRETVDYTTELWYLLTLVTFTAYSQKTQLVLGIRVVPNVFQTKINLSPT